MNADGAERWDLRLYVAGQGPSSLRAVANLHAVCERHLAGRYHVEVVDLVDDPARARLDDVIAVPTVVRRSPGPVRKVIGDLSRTDEVLRGLQLTPTDGNGRDGNGTGARDDRDDEGGGR